MVALVAMGVGAGLAPAPTQKPQNATNERLAHMKAMVAAAKAREAQLGTQVAGFDSQLSSIGGRLDQIAAAQQTTEAKLTVTRDKLVRLRRDLVVKRRQLVVAEAELAREERLFEQRIVAMYKRGSVTSLDVLVGATGWTDLVTRLSFVRDLTRYENDLVAQLAASRARVAAEKRDLARAEVATGKAADQLQAQTQRLAQLKAAAEQQYATLSSTRSAKADLLAKAATTRAGYEQQERELQAESTRLGAIIAGTSGGGHGTGRFESPIAGPVTSGFGWRIHPIFHTREFHTGIDIGAASGSAIHAADSGSIIIAGPEGGYGNCIVIDHGGGLSTLYAHMSGFAATGGAVRRGQVIGYVGMTGFATGPHLHFEVRKAGQPVDPLAYLP
jgi:murein DD-endopeptidase MepM/ murein hydrolase activator NlpD